MPDLLPSSIRASLIPALFLLTLCSGISQSVEIGSALHPTTLKILQSPDSAALIWDNGDARINNAQDAILSNRAKFRILLDADNDNNVTSQFSLFSNTDVGNNDDAPVNFDLDGGDSWINSGNFGIGTNNPNTDLEIQGPENTRAIRWDSARTTLRHHYDMLVTERGWLRFLIDSDNDFSSAHFALYNNKASSSGLASVKFDLDGGASWIGLGNFGLGTSTPMERLEVAGAIKIGTTANPTPGQGTIRWNSGLQEFQGFTSTGWHSLLYGTRLQDQDGDTGILVDNGSDPDTIKLVVENTTYIDVATDTDSLASLRFVNNGNNIQIASDNNQSGSGIPKNNVFIGTNQSNTAFVSLNNVIIGRSVANSNSVNAENTIMGYETFTGGTTTPVRRVTAIGPEIFVPFNSNLIGAVEGSSAFGRLTAIDAPNVIRLGSNSIASIGGYASWSTFSDMRFKQNVTDNVPGLDFILQLRPVTYSLDVKGLNTYYGVKRDTLEDPFLNAKSQEVLTGFLAQDVEAAAASVGYDFSGVDRPSHSEALYALRYAEFVGPLTKAIQEQQALIVKLQHELAAVRDELTALKNE